MHFLIKETKSQSRFKHLALNINYYYSLSMGMYYQILPNPCKSFNLRGLDGPDHFQTLLISFRRRDLK